MHTLSIFISINAYAKKYKIAVSYSGAVRLFNRRSSILFSEKQAADLLENSGASENWKRVYEQYNREYPPLRTLDIQGDVRGTSTPLGDGWTRYENVPLGFSIEYPRSALSKRSPERVSFYNPADDDLSYGIILLHSDVDDTPVTSVQVSPSRFSNIRDWFEHDIHSPRNDPSQPQNILYENVHGKDVLISFPLIQIRPPIPADQDPWFTDKQVPRHMYIINNNLLYIIKIRDISHAEREHILNSFRFIENK